MFVLAIYQESMATFFCGPEKSAVVFAPFEGDSNPLRNRSRGCGPARTPAPTPTHTSRPTPAPDQALREYIGETGIIILRFVEKGEERESTMVELEGTWN